MHVYIYICISLFMRFVVWSFVCESVHIAFVYGVFSIVALIVNEEKNRPHDEQQPSFAGALQLHSRPRLEHIASRLMVVIVLHGRGEVWGRCTC